MAEPVEPPLIPSSEALVQRAIEQLQGQYPNWKPNPASPDYMYFKAFAAICIEVLVMALNVPEAIIRYVGEIVYQTPPFPATFATATSTWEATDAEGHEIEQGTIVLVTPTGGEPVAMEVTEAVVIAPATTTTAAGAVHLRAVEAGTAANVPGASTVQPNAQLAWVKAITLVTPPAGGEEEETTKAYTKRIRELAALIKPQPILPPDFASFVRLLIPGVERCVAVDLLELNRTVPTAKEIEEEAGSPIEAEGVERCVAVIPLTAAGTPPPLATLEAAQNRLIAAREGTFKSFIGLPTVHPIEVKVVGTFFKGYTKAGVEASLKVALEELLSPARHGVPTSGDLTSWVNKKTLRYQDVVTAVNNVLGFNYYTELLVNKGTADVALSGIAPLVKAGALAVSLSEGPE